MYTVKKGVWDIKRLHFSLRTTRLKNVALYVNYVGVFKQNFRCSVYGINEIEIVKRTRKNNSV